MPRSLSERAKDWRWWGEQVAHLALVGAPPPAIVLGFHAWHGPAWQVWGAVLAAVWVTGIRELVDGWPIESVGDAIVDSIFSISGGATAGLVFWFAL